MIFLRLTSILSSSVLVLNYCKFPGKRNESEVSTFGLYCVYINVNISCGNLLMLLVPCERYGTFSQGKNN